MPRSRSRQIIESIELVIAIRHFERDRAAERHTLPHAAENIDRIRLDPLSATATITTLPPTQFDINRLQDQP